MPSTLKRPLEFRNQELDKEFRYSVVNIRNFGVGLTNYNIRCGFVICVYTYIVACNKLLLVHLFFSEPPGLSAEYDVPVGFAGKDCSDFWSTVCARDNAYDSWEAMRMRHRQQRKWGNWAVAV